MIKVRSRVKRILARMPTFMYFEAGGQPIPAGLPLLEGEAPIGIYLNNPPVEKDALLITDMSVIRECDGVWVPIRYASILETVMPPSKVSVDRVDLLLRGGSRYHLPIHTHTPKTSDAFEIIRFLNRVLGDLAEQQEESKRQ